MCVAEDGKFVDVNKVYRRKYNGDIYIIKTKDGRVIVAIPSVWKIGDSKWAVYFMEDNQIYTAIYYTEEKARHRYEKELEKCTR